MIYLMNFFKMYIIFWIILFKCDVHSVLNYHQNMLIADLPVSYLDLSYSYFLLSFLNSVPALLVEPIVFGIGGNILGVELLRSSVCSSTLVRKRTRVVLLMIVCQFWSYLPQLFLRVEGYFWDVELEAGPPLCNFY